MSLRRLLSLVLAPVLALAMAIPVAAAGPVTCHGVAILTSTSNVEVRFADGVTFLEFDFAGDHTICLADGTVDMATIEGRLSQRTGPDGTVNIRFVETLTYNGGTLEFRGEAVGNGNVWRSAVRTVGPGTGSLAGIHGQGTFWPTSATSFADSIAYVYPKG
jgi:hypothetical protein